MKTSGFSSATCWAVAAACGLLNLLTTILSRSPGLLFVGILDRYQTTRELASYPFFLCAFIRCSGGPVTGYFGQRFGVNTVIITGCALSALGVIACFFASDIGAVIVFLGLVHGIGIAFSNTLLPQVLKQYFKENFTTAMGLLTAGLCLGSFIAPPVIEWLFELYGVSGTFLVMGAFILNSVPIALLFIIITPKEGHHYPHTAVQLATSIDEINATIVSADKNVILDQKQANVANKEDTLSAVWEEKKFELRIKPNTEEESDNDSASNVVANHAKLLLKMKGTSSYQREQKSEPIIQDSVEFPDIEKQFNTQGQLSVNKEKYLEACVNNASHSSVKFSDHKNQLVETQAKSNKMQISTSIKNSKVMPKRKTSLESLGVFVDPTFLSIIFTQSCEIFVLYVFLTTIVDYSREKGIDRSKELYFLMSFPIAELFGNFGLGWIVDRHYLSQITFNFIGFALMGFVCMFMTCVKDLFPLMAGTVMFGILSGALVIVFPGIIYEFMEPENHIMALASRFVLFGPMCLAFASFIEYCKTTLGSYDWLYYVLTIISVLCGILTVLTPRFARRRERKKVKKQTIKELSPFLK